MHPALAIPEIVEAVFAQVVVSRIHRSPDAAERDLASAARSCRQFSGPALDRLWSQMATLKPLLDLLDGFREEEGVFFGAKCTEMSGLV
ncbi:hypothetical protein C8R44DRAFT_31092 [Mycena epipterygia]|nr:hypothetical protein C8R44DRAFT_31092 [Mycena epipterygia]